jgi:endoglucanase
MRRARTTIGIALAAAAGVAVALALVLAGTGAHPSAATAARPATRSPDAIPPLSIAIDGDHFVNGAGDTVRLLGVDQPSLEYACEEGWGEDDGMMDATDAGEIAAWHADAVRLPLNEDCWLGINGQPSYGTAVEYRQTVEAYVSQLEADGIYPILDLHWSAPGATVADGQRPMPDANSVSFWSSVASTFAGDHAVVFDAFNEPYSPAADGDSQLAVSWGCWENGGCSVPVAADGTTPDDNDTYVAVGMQALVTAIRDAGASQPIMLGGLSYANDLSGWLANEPTDPDHQLAASLHVYEGNSCDDVSCWNAEVAPVAAQVPVVAGEFGQDCDGSSFDDDFMNWADGAGVSYLAWAWWDVFGDDACNSDNYTVLDDASGTPASPNGTALHDHLATTPAVTTPPSTTLPTSAGAPPTTTTTAPTTTTRPPTVRRHPVVFAVRPLRTVPNLGRALALALVAGAHR